MSILITTIHVIVCLALILIVLLQTGKGANMGSLFGGGSSSSLFGSGGASTFLTKATTIAAIIFMVTSLILTSTSGKKQATSVIEKTKVTQTKDVKTETPTSAQSKQPAAESSDTDNTK
jgi:preprotein translocase subunit SecG